jgi:hypothetical protein
MPVGALIAAGGAIAGGLLGSSGAKSAANKQLQAAKLQAELQERMYRTGLGLNEPWRATGQGALNLLAQMYGLPYMDYSPWQSLYGGGSSGYGGVGERRLDGRGVADLLRRGATPQQIAGYHGPGPANMSLFTATPDYQFRRDEGMRGLEQSAAARGGAFSGNAMAALNERNSNLASQEFANFYDRMMRLAGYGGGTAQNQATMGQNYANSAGQAIGAAGDARASGVAGQYNAWGNAIGDVANIFGDYWRNRQQPSDGGYSRGI